MYSHSFSPSNSLSLNSTIPPTSPILTRLPPIHCPLPDITPPPSLSLDQWPLVKTVGHLHHHHQSSSSAKQKKATTRKAKSSSLPNPNGIEKPRRERINDKIDQLKYLIPSCCPDTLPSYASSMHQPLHKLSVLQAAIDYIHQLHTELVDQSSCLDISSSNQIEILSHARNNNNNNKHHQSPLPIPYQ